MEVIARKEKDELGHWIECFLSVLAGIGVIVFSIVMYLSVIKEDINGIFKSILLALPSLAIFIVLGIDSISYYKTPEDILSYDGERIICSKGEFLLSKIKQVSYTCAKSRYGPLPYGKIALLLDSKKITYNYVRNIKKVYKRLIELTSRKKDEIETIA